MFHRLINNLLSILEHSMVMLSPHAFVKPYEYLYRNETHTQVVAYSRYLNDETEFQANENLKLKVCYLFDHLSFFFVLLEPKVHESFSDLLLFIASQLFFLLLLLYLNPKVQKIIFCIRAL